MANVITPTTAIAYLLNTGEVRDKTGFDDFHPNSTVNQVIIYVEDGDENNVMTINYNPEIIKKWASHWFPLFYRGLVEHTLDGESEPRTFAQYQSYMPTIVSALNINSTGPLEFNSTVRQQAGNNLIGSYPTVASLPTSYGDWVDLQDMEENNVVAYVYEAGVNGFYMVEFIAAIYVWTLQTSGITNFVTAKPYNVIEGTILGGFNNPDEITELTDEQYRLIWQELSILSSGIVANDDDISDILDGTTPVGKAVADQYGNVIDLTYQLISNLVSAFQVTPDNTHYPSEKLVKDTIDAILNGTTEFTKIVTKELVILEIDDTPHSTTWDEEAKTLKTDLGEGVVLQHGQELHVQVKNDNGMAFYDFQLAMINTADPSTGSNLNALLSDFAILGINPRALLGVVTQEIAVANNGKNTTFGAVGGDTRDNATVPKYIISGGAVVRGDWAEGQILYAYTVAGSMVAVDYATLDADLAIALPKPLPRILIGVVERAGASGRIRIRPEFPVFARNIADFENGTYLTGEIFKYNAVTSLFEKFDLDAALLLKSDKTYVDAQLLLKEDKANKGIANGYASLNSSGKVPSGQLPSFVDVVIEVATYDDLPSNLVFSNLNKTITNSDDFNFASLGLVDGSIITVAGTVSNNTNYTVVGIPTATVITLTTAPVEETTTDLVNFTILAVQTYIGGSENAIYVVLEDETSGGNTSVYRWSGSSYILISDVLSAEDIKILYESNPDTNAFTDSEKTKLGTVGTGADMDKSEFATNGKTGLVDKALKVTNDEVSLDLAKIELDTSGNMVVLYRTKTETADNGTTVTTFTMSGSSATIQNTGLAGNAILSVGNNVAILEAAGKVFTINLSGFLMNDDLEVEGTITAEAIILDQPVPVASEVIVVPMTHGTNGDFYATVPGWILTLNHQIVALFPDTLTNLTENVRVSFDGIGGTYKDLKYDDTLNNVVVKHTKLLKSAVYYNGTEWFITGEPLVNQEFIFDEITNSIFGNAKAINGIPSLNNVYGLLLNQILPNGDFATGDITNWVGNATSVTNNILTVTGDGTRVDPRTWNDGTQQLVLGQDYYFRARVRVTNSDCLRLIMRVDLAGIEIDEQLAPAINEWYVLGGVYTASNNDTIYPRLSCEYVDNATANGKVMEIDYAIVVPISNTPLSAKTATQLNAIIPTYFEDIKYITDFELQSIGLNLVDIINNSNDDTLAGSGNIDNAYLGNGRISVGNGSSSNRGKGSLLTLKPSISYTIQAKGVDAVVSGNHPRVLAYDDEGTTLGSVILTVEDTVYNLTITSPADGVVHLHYLINGVDADTDRVEVYDIQINEGSTAETYAPFNSPTTPFKITTDLLSVGTVRDIAYPLNGNWWKDQYVAKDITVVKATTSWGITSILTNTHRFFKDLSSTLGYGAVSGSAIQANIFCKIGDTTFRVIDTAYSAVNDEENLVSIDTVGNLLFRVNKTTYATSGDFETYLQANDVTFIYELADIVTTEIEADGSLIQESNTTLIQGNDNFATEYKIGINFNDKAVLKSVVDKQNQQEEAIVKLEQKIDLGWIDLIGEPHILVIGANDPSYSVYIGTIRQFKYSTSVMNELYFVYHIPHGYVAGTNLYVHTHWSTVTVDTGDVKWYYDISYAKGYDQAPFITPITTSVVQTGSSTAYHHQIVETIITDDGTSLINVNNIETDGLLLIRMYRDPSDVADTLAISPYVHHSDVHIQVDKLSSANRNLPFE